MLLRILPFAMLCMLALSGCASNPDDDLCSVPVTNKPNFIVDSQRGSSLPGAFNM